MANELTLTGSLSFAKGRVAAVSMSKVGAQFNVTGANYARLTTSVGTSAFVALVKGGIGTIGYLYIQNLDATNYVEIAEATSGTGTVKLKPGEFALFRCATSTPSVKANTAACICEYLMVEA